MADILRRMLLHPPQIVYSWTSISARTLLTTAFGQQERMKKFLERRESEISHQTLSSIGLLIDRCTERGMPFSSMTVDDMVHAIEDRDDIVSTMYYLHKFRHCDSCYFLRPWTVHTWFGKCLKHDAMDLALTALDERSQYGTFPDDMMHILLIDKCVKENDIDLAFKFVIHAFLAECFNSELAQLTCLNVVLKIMQNSNTISPRFSSLAERRNFFAVCYRLGQMLGNASIELLGLAELGSIEKEHGIRAIYQEPWCPLLWQEGHLDRASSLLNSTSNLHQEVVNHATELIEGSSQENPEVNKPVSTLNEQSFVTTLLNHYAQRISDAESLAVDRFHETVDSWVKRHDELAKTEKDICTEKLQQRQDFFEEKRMEKLSKKIAVKNLGYWEFMAEEITNEEGLDYHLKADYIEGASSDVEIERRIAARTHA